jgi:excisionase family DNA binding protein
MNAQSEEITAEELLVTPEEASRRLSLGRTTIYRLMSDGELSPVVIGRSRRVAVRSLESYVERRLSTDHPRPRMRRPRFAPGRDQIAGHPADPR